MEKSRLIIDVGFTFNKIAAVLIILAYTVDGWSPNGTITLSFVYELFTSVSDAVHYVITVIILIGVDRLKNNFPTNPNRLTIIDIILGLSMIVSGGVFYYFIVHWLFPRNIEGLDPLILVPSVIFVVGIFVILGGMIINGFSRLALQTIILFTEERSFREELREIASPIRRLIDSHGLLTSYSKEKEVGYFYTLWKAICVGADQLNEGSDTEKNLPNWLIERDPTLDNRIVCNHFGIILTYLIVATVCITIVLEDSIIDVPALIEFAAVCLFISSIFGVISGVYKDSDFIKYESDKWVPRPTFYLFQVILLFFISGVVGTIFSSLSEFWIYIFISAYVSILIPTTHYLVIRHRHFKNFG